MTYTRVGTFWIRSFDKARKTKDWVEIPRKFSYTTARQRACDIRNLHKRSKNHIKGNLPGEKWDAVWKAPHDESKKWNCVVQIRLVEQE